MTPRRLSKRTLAVNKRRQLEAKLQERRQRADLRLEKTRSKALQKLHDQELRLFTEEAFRLCDIVERFELSHNLVDADDASQESLEWDDSQEAPSFLTAASKSDPSVDELIEEILCPSPTEAILQDQADFLQSRRNTSTDPDFLEDPGPAVSSSRENPRYQILDWPPRFPSAEPEAFSPLYSSTLNLELAEVFETEEVFEPEEVFETETPVIGTRMEEEN